MNIARCSVLVAVAVALLATVQAKKPKCSTVTYGTLTSSDYYVSKTHTQGPIKFTNAVLSLDFNGDVCYYDEEGNRIYGSTYVGNRVRACDPSGAQPIVQASKYNLTVQRTGPLDKYAVVYVEIYCGDPRLG